MTAHAPLAPSAAHRWRNCPGSVALSAPLPNTSSKFAEEGTYLHDAIAALLKRGAHPADVDACHLFADRAEDARDEYNELMRRCLSVFHERFDPSEDVALFETRLCLPEIPGIWGTADVVIIGRSRIETIDWKFGRGVEVDATDNEQLEIYLLMAAALYGSVLGGIESYVGTIYQPRLAGPKEWLFGVSTVEPRMQRLTEAARAALSPKVQAPLVDGDWCQFCLAKGICPKLSETAMVAARSAFEPINLAKYAAVDVAKALDVIPRIQQWIEAIQGEALTRLKSGAHLPGYKIVEGKRSRAFTDDARAEAWAKAALGKEAYSKPALLTLAQLEKLSKRAGVEFPPEGSIWEWKHGAEHVAPETDRRDAVKPNALAFDPI